jgi:hypothetical protein
VLPRGAEAIQGRVWVFEYGGTEGGGTKVKRVVVCYSGENEGHKRPTSNVQHPTSNGAMVLAVPFCAQGEGPEAMKHQICSPASVTMVMRFWGIDRPLVENAAAIYDPEYRIFGNWMRAAQRPGEMGLEAWVDRFRNWEQVRDVIAAGEPVVASIQFKAGEFPSAVSKSSDGHLIVIRGFTGDGNIIVNDPADKARGNGAIYNAQDLGRAWFGHGGVGYRIRREP